MNPSAPDPAVAPSSAPSSAPSRAPSSTPPRAPPRPHAVWASGFRPFYLLGAACLGWLLLAAAVALSGVVPGTLALAASATLWHAHEMLYGFAMAVIAGTLLTALPSWAGTPELHGRSLKGLALLWLAGRLAFVAVDATHPGLVRLILALLDTAFVLALLMLLAPQLLRAADRRYTLLLPLLATLVLANLAHHAALARQDTAAAQAALRAALWAIVLLFSLAGGLLTPIFSGNLLAARGRGAQAGFSRLLEAATLLALLALAVADVAQAPAPRVALLALTALATQALRTLRWRGWRVADDALVAGMNLGFAWLMVALALRAATALGAPWPQAAWLHAFTLGALGSMMLALMTRVALRHTGRPLRAPRQLPWLLLVVSVATLLRLLADTQVLGGSAGTLAIAASALAFAACFLAWLAAHARMLLAPSLPRAPAAPDKAQGLSR